jgi:hypothetical protein
MSIRAAGCLLIACLGLAGCSSSSAGPGDPEARESLIASHAPPTDQPGAPHANHPLTPALKWAIDIQSGIERNVKDYTATVVKRERSGGTLSEENIMRAKVRHKPFSVYLGSLAPESMKGQEAIYVEDQNNGNLLGHTTGVMGKLIGTVSLSPTGALAMQGQRHPITEIGVLNLCKRLIERVTEEMNYDECEVKFDRGARLNNRLCTCVEVVHPTRRDYFRFHKARVYVDAQFQVPVRYEAYDWPKQEGAEPELLEEYEYRDLKVNVGLTEADFDVKNPEYRFP